MPKITDREVSALAWAVQRAAEWRGGFTGCDNAGRLDQFDRRMSEARAALRKLRELRKHQQAPSPLPALHVELVPTRDPEAAARILRHYFRTAFLHAGAKWDSDNDAEMRLLVGYLTGAAK